MRGHGMEEISLSVICRLSTSAICGRGLSANSSGGSVVRLYLRLVRQPALILLTRRLGGYSQSDPLLLFTFEAAMQVLRLIVGLCNDREELSL